MEGRKRYRGERGREGGGRGMEGRKRYRGERGREGGGRDNGRKKGEVL